MIHHETSLSVSTFNFYLADCKKLEFHSSKKLPNLYFSLFGTNIKKGLKLYLKENDIV